MFLPGMLVFFFLADKDIGAEFSSRFFSEKFMSLSPRKVRFFNRNAREVARTTYDRYGA